MNKLLAILILLAAFTMPALAQWQGRLSPDDQRGFDKAYAKWVNDSRKNDRDDLDKDVRRMQEIMARYNIPSDVPFDRIASSAYPNSSGNSYPSAGYQSYAGRLSPEDQHRFDKAYAEWVEDTRKHDRDDIPKDMRKMQDIMARYNIPANVPFDAIASPNAALTK